MKAEINGMMLEGEPAEILEFYYLVNSGSRKITPKLRNIPTPDFPDLNNKFVTKKKWLWHKWTAEEKKTLRFAYRQETHLTVEEIHKKYFPHITRSQMNHQIKKMGLKKAFKVYKKKRSKKIKSDSYGSESVHIMRRAKQLIRAYGYTMEKAFTMARAERQKYNVKTLVVFPFFKSIPEDANTILKDMILHIANKGEGRLKYSESSYKLQVNTLPKWNDFLAEFVARIQLVNEFVLSSGFAGYFRINNNEIEYVK